MKLAIVGNGAIGGLLALACERAGFDYALLTRSGESVSLLCEDLHHPQQQLNPKVFRLGQWHSFELLILPVKAFQIVPVVQQIQHQLKQQQTLVLLHNGMGVADIVHTLLPDNPIVAATTSYGAYKPASNKLHVTGYGQTHGGWIANPSDKIQMQLQQLFNQLLPPFTWHQDVALPMWHKLAVNAVINPLTALDNIKNGALLDAAYRVQIRQLCMETATVMTAAGYPADAGDLVAHCLQVSKDTADNYSSMQQDLALGRTTEIDFINGYIVKQGERLGVPTEQHKLLWQAISGQSDSHPVY